MFVDIEITNICRQRWIGRGAPIAWPPKSPDLTLCDYFLWGYIKPKVYATPPTTVENMQQRIRDAFGTINQAMLTNVINDFRIRLELCLEEEGGIFEHRL
jgi:hypothetical protein